LKLAIGTAQFGARYGIANTTGQVNKEDIASILELAKKYGVDTIDTAISYGDSEKNLGAMNLSGLKIVTKLPPIPNDCIDVKDWINSNVRESLKRLKVNRIYGLLLHKPEQLLDSRGPLVFSVLEQLKTDGLVEKTGISVYGPEQLDLLCPKYSFDLVQSPMNLIDRRLLLTGWLDKLQANGVETHIRSVFLQGLLLSETLKRQKYFSQWDKVWKDFEKWLSHSDLNPLQACLGYILNFEQVSKIVVGIDSPQQFLSILEAAKESAVAPPDSIASTDNRLINPSHWPESTV
jgi:aryl-alcohol dehydrogenase-like predicted oxidoreductase